MRKIDNGFISSLGDVIRIDQFMNISTRVRNHEGDLCAQDAALWYAYMQARSIGWTGVQMTTRVDLVMLARADWENMVLACKLLDRFGLLVGEYAGKDRTVYFDGRGVFDVPAIVAKLGEQGKLATLF